MSVVLVTGSCGLVGSEAVRYFSNLGMDVIGIDNGMREVLFGKDAATQKPDCARYTHFDMDIRDFHPIEKIFQRFRKEIVLVIHAAAQPSHDWAASDPAADWSINATGTSVLLEATRKYCSEAVFIFLSTNKVYGDLINTYSFTELETRYEPSMWLFSRTHGGAMGEEYPIDRSLHSLFGASKLAADVLVQEYGRYFGMRTACFRCGCITGPNHAGVPAHGFLSYLAKCATSGTPYTVFGYKAKQVRDNIHSADLVRAFHELFLKPRCGDVFNMGGGRESNCSILEAIKLCELITGQPMKWEYNDVPRRGDHIWWISDTSKFKARYPNWKITRTTADILTDISERWASA